jgi:hypothetical protein
VGGDECGKRTGDTAAVIIEYVQRNFLKGVHISRVDPADYVLPTFLHLKTEEEESCSKCCKFTVLIN